ncbi:DUF2000 domain-containing protein [Streptomyces sp. P1-3]|uniref:DUF2000 domain-containing protein n=1 Tax=Streptomyces sp. P1-3 TaxID=3421658 RepID=UPI003D36075B
MEHDLRTVIVLNKKLDPGRMLNVTGHLMLALATGMPEADRLRPRTYVDADGGIHPAISHHPVIVLQAKNSNALRTLRANLREKGIFCTDFTHTMADGGTEVQMETTRTSPEAELEYYGVCCFGSRAQLDAMTRKFSLVKGTTDSADPPGRTTGR